MFADDFNNIVSGIKGTLRRLLGFPTGLDDGQVEEWPINVTRALKIHFKEPDDPKSRLKVRRLRTKPAQELKGPTNWRF